MSDHVPMNIRLSWETQWPGDCGWLEGATLRVGKNEATGEPSRGTLVPFAGPHGILLGFSFPSYEKRVGETFSWFLNVLSFFSCF